MWLSLVSLVRCGARSSEAERTHLERVGADLALCLSCTGGSMFRSPEDLNPNAKGEFPMLSEVLRQLAATFHSSGSFAPIVEALAELARRFLLLFDHRSRLVY